MTPQNTLEPSDLKINLLNKEVEKLSLEIKILNEQLAWFKKQIFGKKSEKFIPVNPEQPLLPGIDSLPKNELKSEKIIGTHIRKKYDKTNLNKLSFPDDLPKETIVIDLKDEDKICQETGNPLVKIGEEIQQKLAHRPGSYFIKEIIRPKYAASKNSECGVLIENLPDSLLQRCKADESLLADILVKKFADHLPLYRQSEMLGRENIFVSRQLLSQWVINCGHALKPLYNEMFKQILSSNNVFIDEIPVDMLKPGKGKVQQAYMWVLAGGNEANPHNRIYNFRIDRTHQHVVDILKGYNGVLHSDKFGAYETLARKKQFTWCPCWVHIRRKFIEAESGDLAFRNLILRKIKYLFMFERIAWSRSESERLRIREKHELPIIDELINLVKNRSIEGALIPKSKFKEALGYFLGLVPFLKSYTQHPYARLDNNVAERAVRPLAIGRKNWLFLGSEEGGEAAAIILSLVQTCRSVGINPRDYLEDVMRRLMSHNSQKLDELLPINWVKS